MYIFEVLDCLILVLKLSKICIIIVNSYLD